MTLGELRASLTDFQKELLRQIADAYLATGMGISMRVLHSRFQKMRVVEALRPLGGGVVVEAEDYQEGNRYRPTFLGLLLSPNGEHYEDLITRYVEYLELLYTRQPERNVINCDEIEHHLQLAKDDSILLHHLVMISNLWGISAGFSPRERTWQVGVFKGVDDLPSWASKRDFVHHWALKAYDPEMPVFLSEPFHPWSSILPSQRSVGLSEDNSTSAPGVSSEKVDLRGAQSLVVNRPPEATEGMQGKRFLVALSFPSEYRPFIEQVAAGIAKQVGRERVLYDKYHEAELARPDLDTYLPNLYCLQAELIVIFLCADYAKKRWCKLEWRFIKQLILTSEEWRVMFISFDNVGPVREIGILSGDGYVSVGARTPDEIAGLILQRLELNRGASSSETSKASQELPTQEIGQIGSLRQVFGVFWDGDYNMRCLSCRKPLKNSTIGPSVFFCSDPNCNSKHILKDARGTKITREDAVNRLKQGSEGERREVGN